MTGNSKSWRQQVVMLFAIWTVVAALLTHRSLRVWLFYRVLNRWAPRYEMRINSDP